MIQDSETEEMAEGAAATDRLRQRGFTLVASKEGLLESTKIFQAFHIELDNGAINFFEYANRFGEELRKAFKVVRSQFRTETANYETAKITYESELKVFIKHASDYALMHSALWNDDQNPELIHAKEVYDEHAEMFQIYQNSFDSYEAGYLSLREYYEALDLSFQKQEKRTRFSEGPMA